MPASSPALASSSSTVKPRRSAQRMSMRSTISAQSCASVPPAPRVDRDERVAGVVGAGEQALLLERRRAGPRPVVELLGDLVVQRRVLLGELEHRLEVADVAGERLPGVQATRGAGVLGGDLRGLLLVVPEAGRAHPPLELGHRAGQAIGIEVGLEVAELHADRLQALRRGLGVRDGGHPERR